MPHSNDDFERNRGIFLVDFIWTKTPAPSGLRTYVNVRSELRRSIRFSLAAHQTAHLSYSSCTWRRMILSRSPHLWWHLPTPPFSQENPQIFLWVRIHSILMLSDLFVTVAARSNPSLCSEIYSPYDLITTKELLLLFHIVHYCCRNIHSSINAFRT